MLRATIDDPGADAAHCSDSSVPRRRGRVAFLSARNILISISKRYVQFGRTEFKTVPVRRRVGLARRLMWFRQSARDALAFAGFMCADMIAHSNSHEAQLD